ncbi:Ig-like domain-containing protein [Niallia sp. NCCP-28]|uniref:Ig-like domain-containing protein n=1 Tax=Niallia sp. NCCP-28 TaxID=2934712 RepID=UPI002089886D|nr:Ig-like domain-containing protein [Niallia sp. NCCP-28]GKU83545.1 hypothetical protein NCCP28_29410 [Niallia sp. NCCP-28]
MKRILSVAFFLILIGLFSSELAHAKDYSISSGVAVKGTIASVNAENTYKFTTNKDGEVYITLDQTTGGFYMELYDANGNEIDYDYNSTKGSKLAIYEKVSKGTYYVKIKPYSWSGIKSASYQLKATYAGSFKRNTATFEPNDTFETGLSIKSGQLYKSASDSNIDRDIYNFTTNKDGEVYVTLENITGGYYMSLYDEYGNEVEYDYDSTGGAKLRILEKIQKGKYYLEIKPYSWSGITGATYQLKVTYPGAINRSTSTFEPNETKETSLSIVSNKYYSSSSYSSLDRDVYQFTTNRSGNVSITLDNTTGGYYISLYDVYGNEINYDYASSRGSKLIISEELSKGTYYFYIDPYSWSGITKANYRLKASFLDKTPTVDTISDKSTVITGKAESNIKVYAYAGSKKLGEATAKSGKYSIKISKQKAGTSISVYTVDKAGNTSANKTVKVLDKTAPKTPSVDSVSDKSTAITGTAEAKSKVYAYVGSKKIGETTVPSNGKYSIKISKQKAGTSISVYSVDAAKNKSGTKTVKVLDKTAPSAPIVNKVTSKTTTVTGKAEKSATVSIYNGSKKLGAGKADSKGNYKVKIAAQKKGSTLNVYASDAAGNKSSAKSVKVN